MRKMNRRLFLQTSAALSNGGIPCLSVIHSARAAARIDPPMVDRLVIQEVTDGYHDLFLRGTEVAGLSVQRTGMPGAPQGKTLNKKLQESKRCMRCLVGFTLRLHRPITFSKLWMSSRSSILLM